MRCPECSNGNLIEKDSVPQQDVTRALGVPVLVFGAPALQCEACGAILTPGHVLEGVMPALAAAMAQVSNLGPREARFLRKTLDLTQTELAEKLNISRATVARWEDERDGGLKGADSYALRALVGTHFLGVNEKIAERIFHSLKETPKAFPPQRYGLPYRDNGAQMCLA